MNRMVRLWNIFISFLAIFITSFTSPTPAVVACNFTKRADNPFLFFPFFISVSLITLARVVWMKNTFLESHKDHISHRTVGVLTLPHPGGPQSIKLGISPLSSNFRNRAPWPMMFSWPTKSSRSVGLKISAKGTWKEKSFNFSDLFDSLEAWTWNKIAIIWRIFQCKSLLVYLFDSAGCARTWRYRWFRFDFISGIWEGFSLFWLLWRLASFSFSFRCYSCSFVSAVQEQATVHMSFNIFNVYDFIANWAIGFGFHDCSSH